MDRCSKCGSDRVEPGSVGSAALWLDKQSAWSRALAGAPIKLDACMDCGHVELRATPEALRKLLD